MTHKHTQSPSDGSDALRKSFDSDTCKSGDESIRTQAFQFESLNGTTSLIPEPEEISTEAIKLDVLRDGMLIGSGSSGDQSADSGEMSADQERLLNSTFSGVDVSMVQSLLGNQRQLQDSTPHCLPVETDISVTIECVAQDISADSHESEKNTGEDDEALIETMQYTGIIPAVVEGSMFSHKTGLESMHNPADYVEDSGAKQDFVVHESTAGKEFYDISNHVFDCYIENDCSGIDNEDKSMSEGSVLICSTIGEVESQELETNEDHRSQISRTLTKNLRKTDHLRRALHESLMQLIGEIPLVSEYELYELLKGANQFSGMKMNKRRFTKVLEQLRLGSSYERFRYFVKA